MKLLSVPIRLLWRLIVLPVKILLASAGLTFRAGFKAGTLPVKGGVAAGRRLGLKALILFAGGVALGVVIGRRLGARGAELAEASYPGSFGLAEEPEPHVEPAVVATLVEDSIEVVDTPDGPIVALVEDTIEVVETAEGEVVSETVTITELDEAEVEALVEAEMEQVDADSEEEIEDELEAEIDRALGNTGGELGVDTDTAGDR